MRKDKKQQEKSSVRDWEVKALSMTLIHIYIPMCSLETKELGYGCECAYRCSPDHIKTQEHEYSLKAKTDAYAFEFEFHVLHALMSADDQGHEFVKVHFAVLHAHKRREIFIIHEVFLAVKQFGKVPLACHMSTDPDGKK